MNEDELIRLTDHALERIIERSFTAEEVNAVLLDGKRYYIPQRNAFLCVKKHDDGIRDCVILALDGKTVITTYRKQTKCSQRVGYIGTNRKTRQANAKKRRLKKRIEREQED